MLKLMFNYFQKLYKKSQPKQVAKQSAHNEKKYLAEDSSSKKGKWEVL